MKNFIINLSVSVLFAIVILSVLPLSNAAKPFPDKVQSNTISLFNGHDLDGWYTFLKGRGRNNDPKSVFSVTDGAIRISGEEWGCITTDNEYENYHLVVEFKWGNQTFDPRLENARDSGILLHSTGADGAASGAWMHSIECQIIEGGTGDFLAVGDGSSSFSVTCPVAPEKQGGSNMFKPGGNYVTIYGGRINWFGRDPDWQDIKGFHGENDVEKPTGQWNKLECIVNNGEITAILNGILVNHAVAVNPRKGHIQIQSEGAEILFKRVELLPITVN